jgi:putative ABC transport system permease protein
MTFLSALRVALTALLVNKGRSALTSLGIVIGIAAVIGMVSAGDGARFKLDERLASVGKNLIIIRSGAHTASGAIADIAPLTHEDATALRRHLGPEVRGVSETQLTQRVASSGTRHWLTLICGATDDLRKVREWETPLGRFLNDDDLRRQSKVCVIGQTVQRKLFPDIANPIGRTLQVERVTLHVVGVLGTKGKSPTGADQDDQIMVPLTTLQQQIAGEVRIGLILVATSSADQTDPTKQRILQILRQQHHRVAGSEDFDVSTVSEMAELAVVMTKTLRGLIAIIASISLIVGGIGIMNIMLVSVTERTREIGIRMAVGATPLEVLGQFLLESVVLSLVGGILGIALGMGIAFALARLVGWPLVISPGIVLLACAVSAAVGVFFGFYPARKASRLDPIDALRHE